MTEQISEHPPQVKAVADAMLAFINDAGTLKDIAALANKHQLGPDGPALQVVALVLKHLKETS